VIVGVKVGRKKTNVGVDVAGVGVRDGVRVTVGVEVRGCRIEVCVWATAAVPATIVPSISGRSGCGVGVATGAIAQASSVTARTSHELA